MEKIIDALAFMPQHRKESRRSSTLGLDELLDDARSLRELDGGSLDLVMMGYRFHARSLREIENFLGGKKLKPAALEDLLSLCFSSLLTRDKIPVAIQVNNFVEAAAKRFGPHTKGLVNAFARGTLRKLDSLKKELLDNPIAWLPAGIQKQWKNSPETLKDISKRVFERPESGLSAFYFNEQSQKIQFERRPLSAWKDLEAEGQSFQAMDQGSWLLVQWLLSILPTDKKENFRFLDACAAPGGKCLALASLISEKMEIDIQVHATDSKFPRIQKLIGNIDRWKKSIPTASSQKTKFSTQLFAWGEDDVNELTPPWATSSKQELTPDLILADLPCSGSGTLHTRPDLLNENLEMRITQLQPLQKNILEALMKMKSPNLVVAICSVDPREIENVSKVLGRKPDFKSWQNPDATLAEGLVAWHLQTKDSSGN